MASEHVLEVEVKATVAEGVISNLQTLKTTLENVASVAESMKNSLGELLNLQVNNAFSDLIKQLSDFKGEKIPVEITVKKDSKIEVDNVVTKGVTVSDDAQVVISNVIALVKSARFMESGADNTLEDVVALIDSVKWKSGVTDDRKTLDVLASVAGFKERSIEYDGQVLAKAVTVMDVVLSTASGSSHTIEGVYAHVVNVKWSDNVDPSNHPLRDVVAQITSITNNLPKFSIPVEGIVTNVTMAAPKESTSKYTDVNSTFNVADHQTDVLSSLLSDAHMPELASGKTVVVGEAGDDEFIIPKQVINKGPAYLESTMAALVKGDNGGSRIHFKDAKDFDENVSIIPAGRKDEFISRIYNLPRFGDGKTETSTATFSSDFSSSWTSFQQAFFQFYNALDKMNMDNGADQSAVYNAITELSRQIRGVNSATSNISSIITNLSEGFDELPGYIKAQLSHVADMNTLVGSMSGKVEQTFDSIDDALSGGNTPILKRGAESAWADTGETLKQVQTVLTAVRNVLDEKDKKAESKEEVFDASGGTSSAGGVVHADEGFKSVLSRIYDKVSEGTILLDHLNKASASTITMSEEEQKRAKASYDSGYGMGNAFFGRAFSAGADISESLLKKTLGFVQDIYNKLKEASPLLQTVETLFNLAMRLFFMPLGNKLAEVLIPSTVKLVETITDMWDMFDEGMTLGEMFATAIDYGMDALGGYFTEIGDALSEQGGFIGSIGRMLNMMGNFIQRNGESLLNTVTWLTEKVLGSFREIIGVVVAFKTASYVQNMMLAFAVYHANTAANFMAGAAPGLDMFMAGLKVAALQAVVPAIVGAIAGGVTTGAMYGIFPQAAEGGYVAPRAGGTLVNVAESGEGEYIIPESNLLDVLAGGTPLLADVAGGSSVKATYASVGGSSPKFSYAPSASAASDAVTVSGGQPMVANYYINGYTDSELRKIIVDTVNDLTYDSRLKGRYW